MPANPNHWHVRMSLCCLTAPEAPNVSTVPLRPIFFASVFDVLNFQRTPAGIRYPGEDGKCTSCVVLGPDR